MSLENLDDDGLDEVKGLDDSEEMDTFIYLESSEGLVLKFNPEHLKHIDLVQTILKSDKSSGTEDNTIRLSIINNSNLKLLSEYINYHGGNDYVPIEDPNISYSDKMTLWDRNFVNELNLKNLIFEMVKISAYLMYDTLNSKLCCFMANSETSEDYKEIFREIRYSN